MTGRERVVTSYHGQGQKRGKSADGDNKNCKLLQKRNCRANMKGGEGVIANRKLRHF
jgi:hypothetical protein